MMRNKKQYIILALLMITISLNVPANAIYRRPPGMTPYYHYIIGRMHISYGRIKEAIKSLENARRYNEHSWSVNWDLLELYYITGLYYKARHLAIKMYGTKPNDPKLLELLADIYANTEDSEKAVEIYNKILKQHPKSNLARLNMASLQEKKGDQKAAIAEYLTVLKNDSRNLYARLALADAYLEMKKYKASAKNYLEAVKYGADEKEINIQVAKIYTHKKKYKKAISYLKKNLLLAPEDIQTRFLMVELLKKQGKLAEAEKFLIEMKDGSPSNLNVLLNLGTMYSDMEEIEKALSVFQEVTKNFKNEFSGWYLLGLTYEYMEKYEKALEIYNRALEIKEDPQLYFHMGVIYDRIGDKQKVYEALQNCLALDPMHPGANNYLGYTWAEQGIRLKEAEEYIIKAVESDPENEAYLDSLGWVYYQQGRYDEAVVELEKAAANTKDAVILEHLGDAYVKMSRIVDAKKSYERSLKLATKNIELQKKLDALKK